MLIAICEDEKIFAEKLSEELDKLLSDKKIEHEIVYFREGNLLVKKLKDKFTPDLLFMDIQLEDEDGVDIMREIRSMNINTPTVFLTSMEERIADGYDVSAFHFLFKKDYSEKLPALLERFIKEKYQENQIIIKPSGTLLKIKLTDIYYVEPDKRNTSIHLKEESYIENESIQNFAKKLSKEAFIEAYHSVYVNLDHIDRVNQDTLILDNGQSLPVSRRKRKELMMAIMKRIENR